MRFPRILKANISSFVCSPRRFKGKPKRVDDIVEATITVIPGSEWLKIVPTQPLPPGEYAIEAKMADPSAYSLQVYDFGVSPPSAKKD
jgi:hypothetical protein